MEDDSGSRDKIDLLHPEILSKEGLIVLLRERSVVLGDVGSLDKDALVNLYYSVILPLPQRKYRLNRRGREMTKRQILKAKRRVAAPGAEKKGGQEKQTYSIIEKPGKQKAPSGDRLRSPPSGDRLKPPPGDRLKPPPGDETPKDKKTIKLSSSPSDTSSSIIKIHTKTYSKPEKSQVTELTDSTKSNSAVVQKPCSTTGVIRLKSPTKDRPSVIKLNPSSNEDKTDKSAISPTSIGIINTHLTTDTDSKAQTIGSNSADSTSLLGKRQADTESNSSDSLKTKFKKVNIKWP